MYQASERAIGNLAVARITGDVIEFQVPDPATNAAADVIRRCIARTNPEAAKQEAARQSRQDAQQKRADEERKRVQAKYHDGL